MTNSKLQSLLIITPNFWPEVFRINEVAGLVADAGIAVTVLTGQPNYPEGKTYKGFKAFAARLDVSASGMTIARVPTIPRGQRGRTQLLLNYLSFLLSACVVGTFLLRRRNFDAILFYGVSPTLLAAAGLWFRMIKKAPLSLWVQDLWPSSLGAVGLSINPILNRLLEFAIGRIYRSCDLVLIASRSFVIDIQRLAGRNVDCVYHPNPAELAVANAPPVTELKRPHDTFEVLFAGNLGRASGLSTILDTAKMLEADHTVRFRVIGGGSRRHWLDKEIARLGLHNITVENRISPSEMPAALSRASALLITLASSPAMTLSLPSKTPTYLASATPLIVSADGETARVVEEAKAGLCVKAQDPAALANAIKRLQNLSDDERAEMGRAGRAYSQRWFDPNQLSRRLVDLLQASMQKQFHDQQEQNAG